jgi:transmembrane sensor
MNENSISDSLYEAMIAYYGNKITQEQADILLAWIRENNDNLAYFQETGKIWYASGMIKKCEKDPSKAWLNLVQKIEDNEKRPFPKPVVRIRISTIYKLAVSVLLLVSLGIASITIFKNRNKVSGNSFFEAVAPKGSRSVVTLLDGSIVWLNSGTTLRYTADFGKTSRNVNLEGEAFFSVSENKEIPFMVRTPEICITALGTSFNVKAYSDENTIETTLESGEIKIDNINRDGNITMDESVFLKPNQKAVFMKNTGNLNLVSRNQASPVKKNEKITKIKPVQIVIDTLVDTKLTTSWKDSRWIFKSERLSKLVPILERRYDVTITFMDSALIDYKFTGTLEEESLKQVLNALSLAAPIIFEVSQNNVFLYENQELRSRYQRQVQQQNQ